ncbi:methyltransferase RlmB [Seminavis robusta]|uniref:Methyltransferase RlmB n=1 Tax=Seminavis robusta TaxID=568900 RepID=A0A9N8HKM7_9STRA|nr:methyltransferase RlmB [Seminavis robusta]|eukprot:Sro744_g196170.1 methyltransferase RlmB (462) ;mRNA; r:13628-15013
MASLSGDSSDMKDAVASPSNSKKRPNESTANNKDDTATHQLPSVNGKSIREEKRRKWQAKQEKKSQKSNQESQREDWLETNKHFASMISMQDVQDVFCENSLRDKESAINGDQAKTAAKMVMSESGKLAKLLEPYRNIQDKKENPHSTSSPSKGERYFIAEGTETVRLLIQQSTKRQKRVSSHSPSPTDMLPSICIQSVFIKTNAFFENPVFLQKDIEEASTKAGPDNTDKNNPNPAAPPFAVLIGTDTVQSKVVGFPFSRGALACGIVPSWSDDEDWLWGYLKSMRRTNNQHPTTLAQQKPLRIVALDGVCDTANLGSVVRTASAFGVHAIILSRDSCDVWYRKAVRVSMGHVCRVPSVRVASLTKTLQRLQEELQLDAYAAVIDNANCVLEQMKQGDVSGNGWCCVIGNEGNGISKAVVQACNKKIRIAMEEGVDSLSVPVSTGILLHGLREREAKALL